MNVSINDNTETRKDVVVSFTAEEIAEESGAILKKVQKSAQIRGFRAGKAPLNLVKQRYSKEIAGELANTIVSKAIGEIRKSDAIRLYEIVALGDVDDIPEDSEFSLDITVDVVPEFTLPEYKGVTVKVPSDEVGDQEIEEFIDRIRRQRADFEVVDRAACAGDYVKVSYTGTLEGERIAPLLESHSNLRSWGLVIDGWEEAGTEEAKQFGVPAVIDGLVGMAAGEEKTVEQEMADTFPVEDLRGKSVQYAVTVAEVRERVLPEIDDAFLKSVNAETLEDFKGQILDHLENQKKSHINSQKRDQILNTLAAGVDFPLPQSGVEKETEQAMVRIMQQNMQKGVEEKVFEENKEALHASALQTAHRDLKLQLILARISTEENISVSDQDLSAAIYSVAQQQQRKPEDLVKDLRKDRQQLLNLQRQVLFSKTLDFLTEHASVEISGELAENNPS